MASRGPPCDSPASCFHILQQACKRLTTRCYNIIMKSSVGTLDKSDVSIKTCLSLKLTLDVGMFIILLVAKFRLGQSNSFSLRAKVPQLFCSRERKFYDAFAPGSESSTSFSLQGAKVPRHFHTWNFHSRERKFLRAKVP